MKNADIRDTYIEMLEAQLQLYKKLQKENIRTYHFWLDLLNQGHVDEVIESIKIVLSIGETAS